ncbi:ExbD/TolR family protein [Roseicyclus mahoneyensis]|uniref:ExbD/TolR family protein n=1 Tax=Roseicyclus mahoneyensis TaxID=164332 RepID=UPI001FEBFADF|nr:biopolymer transporter ExbD [Roseicyclus mahoneyensis]
MTFGGPSRPRGGQDRAIVPMINVVFLLLIFFLMTASLTPPPPQDLTPPTADMPQTDPEAGTLYIMADGTLIFGATTGEDALAALAEADRDGPLPVLADAAFSAADLARLLPRLAAQGVSDIRLITVRP